MFLTETWLSQDNGAAALIESAPPNFSFISEARVNKKGGGVAILKTSNVGGCHTGISDPLKMQLCS